ncbi:hypothetical protein O3P69_011632 [Scylla paramamosain]|uniref:Gustatory receptor n=1 Tax=Scylla paramamosain TaxID=85552 RepID=A0AAW0T7V6_SCYPA
MENCRRLQLSLFLLRLVGGFPYQRRENNEYMKTVTQVYTQMHVSEAGHRRASAERPPSLPGQSWLAGVGVVPGAHLVLVTEVYLLASSSSAVETVNQYLDLMPVSRRRPATLLTDLWVAVSGVLFLGGNCIVLTSYVYYLIHNGICGYIFHVITQYIETILYLLINCFVITYLYTVILLFCVVFERIKRQLIGVCSRLDVREDVNIHKIILKMYEGEASVQPPDTESDVATHRRANKANKVSEDLKRIAKDCRRTLSQMHLLHYSLNRYLGLPITLIMLTSVVYSILACFYLSYMYFMTTAMRIMSVSYFLIGVLPQILLSNLPVLLQTQDEELRLLIRSLLRQEDDDTIKNELREVLEVMDESPGFELCRVFTLGRARMLDYILSSLVNGEGDKAMVRPVSSKPNFPDEAEGEQHVAKKRKRVTVERSAGDEQLPRNAGLSGSWAREKIGEGDSGSRKYRPVHPSNVKRQTTAAGQEAQRAMGSPSSYFHLLLAGMRLVGAFPFAEKRRAKPHKEAKENHLSPPEDGKQSPTPVSFISIEDHVVFQKSPFWTCWATLVGVAAISFFALGWWNLAQDHSTGFPQHMESTYYAYKINEIMDVITMAALMLYVFCRRALLRQVLNVFKTKVVYHSGGWADLIHSVNKPARLSDIDYRLLDAKERLTQAHELGRLANMYCGVPVTLLMLFSVVTCILSLFFTSFITELATYDIILTLAFTLNSLVTTIYLCNAPNIVREKLQDLKFVLRTLLYNPGNKRIRTKLRHLLALLQVAPPPAMLGLFILGRSNITSVLGFISTYVVILLQFRFTETSTGAITNTTHATATTA